VGTPIHRADGELCGFVERSGVEWKALTVFGGTLGVHSSEFAATQDVLEEGLASLARHWLYRSTPADEWQTVCIIEASPESVRIALDYYSMPGVPTALLTAADLANGAGLVKDW
jgi:hypothetical protein